MGTTTNPFPDDPDRSAIWQMLVQRDIDAFLAADWSMVEDDFEAATFHGLHAQFEPHPDRWMLAFPTLAHYRDEWLRQARETAAIRYAEPLREALFRATDGTHIELAGALALLRKRFDGDILREDGTSDRLDWQTLYILSRRSGQWRIASFVGYLPR